LTADFAACYQRGTTIASRNLGPAMAASKKTAAASKPAASKTAGGDLDADFKAATQSALKLKEDPGNDMKLKLYAYFKQASEGDVAGARPGMFDFVGAAKYDAWAKLKGTEQAAAKTHYIKLVKGLG